MNNKRRKRLCGVSEDVSKCISTVESILSEEEDSLDNVPENLQGGNPYFILEDNVDLLNDIVVKLEEVVDMISELRSR
jgi:RNA binding exosome subunit